VNARIVWCAAACLVLPAALVAQGKGLAAPYTGAVQKLNEEHARKPKGVTEADLARRFPAAARKSLDALLKAKDSPEVLDALVACGEAALDLDLLADFDRIRERLEGASPEQAKKLGVMVSRPRFLVHGAGGLDRAYLENFADVVDAILAAYDEVFGFKEWSKLPGKKLRFRVHLEEKITRPPHFAPQFPFHSEVDFPVIPGSLRSPTPEGQFLFYGLCHELGHVIAMWGNGKGPVDEDRHQWAHYTGVTIVEHLAETAKDKPCLQGLADVRWRSLRKERERLQEQKLALASDDGVLALLIALHDQVGPKAIGDAINHLDALDRRLRVKRVRYYTFKEIEEALIAGRKDPKDKAAVARVFAEARGGKK
jgi:hypothetical protein